VKPLFIPVELVDCIVFCIVYHKIISLGVLLLLSFFFFFFFLFGSSRGFWLILRLLRFI
jgi:hypothetical protein